MEDQERMHEVKSLNEAVETNQVQQLKIAN